MAKQFLTGLDLNKNELLNARIQNLSSNPASPVAGQIYYNTSDNTLRYYNGTSWLTLAQGGDLTTAISNAIDALTTDDIEQGSNNLYYSSANAKSDAADLLVNASLTNITITGDGNGLTITAENGVADSTTDDLTEGVTNLYYTDARVDSYVSGSMSTDDLSEGSINLYYNDSRARGAVSGDNTYITYNSSTGEFALDTANAATVAYVDQEISDVNNTINGLTTTDITEGTNLYYTDARARAAVASGDNTLTYNANTGVFTANTSTLALKSYVDSQIQASAQGLDVKESVRAATTQNINLDPGFIPSIDGVYPSNGDRILVKNQTNAAENGIYEFVSNEAQNTFVRTEDAQELTPGTFVFVEEGSTYADTGWVISTDGAITVGTTNIAWTQFSGAGVISAGAGLTQTGTVFDVVGTTDRITVNADSIDIAATYEGQSSIVTVGTITTGTWNGTTIDVAHGGTGQTSLASGEYLVGNGTGGITTTATIPVSDLDGTLPVAQGGTGATTAAGARSNLGATTKYAASNAEITPSSGIATWAVSHNLNTSDVVVSVRDLGDNSEVMVDVVHTDANTITLTWTAASTVAANSYRVVVIG